ncbi:MAG TPA: GNAT family N-acetyltransferase [Chthoniobacterales bacterium]|nr:GNAT family N-acetyltransferase [Chthoniobacterales bacterium]
MQGSSVRLFPHTTEHLRTLLESAEAYAGRFGIRVADGLRDFLIGPEVSPEFLARLNSSAEPDLWKDGFGVLLEPENILIGFCSFTGPPTANGMVEIAYGIAPGYQGHGHATEAARAIVEYAYASGQVRTIEAHTLPEQNASTRVLEKCGFSFSGEIIHPTDGRVWRWELRR